MKRQTTVGGDMLVWASGNLLKRGEITPEQYSEVVRRGASATKEERRTEVELY